MKNTLREFSNNRLFCKEVNIIIEYYEQSFFGGRTYYKLSKKDKEMRDKSRKNNIAVIKFLHNKNVINKKTLKDFVDSYKNK